MSNPWINKRVPMSKVGEGSGSASCTNSPEQVQNLTDVSQLILELINSVLAQSIVLPPIDCDSQDYNVTGDEQVDNLIKNIQNDGTPADYFALKFLLDDPSNSFSPVVLHKIFGTLCDSSIFHDHIEETTIILELNLRTLLAAIRIYTTTSKTTITREFRKEMFDKLAKFSDSHFYNSNIATETMKKSGSHSSSSLLSSYEDKLLRNYNIDFLLAVFRDTINDKGNIRDKKELSRARQTPRLSVNNNTIKEISVTGTEIRLTEQLRNTLDLDYPKSSWYLKWKQLVEKKGNLFKLSLDNTNIEFQEKELLEELWMHVSSKSFDSDPQKIDDEPLADTKSFWFGVLDVAQELAAWTQSTKTLIFIYYLALQSLQRGHGAYIRSKAIELLISLLARHPVLFSEFEAHFMEFLASLSANKQEKYKKLFEIVMRRFQSYRRMANACSSGHHANLQSKINKRIDASVQHSNTHLKDATHFDIIADELTCPITQDLGENFKKLPCGHCISEEGIKGWTKECKSKSKLFSCCICRAEFLWEKVESAPISYLHRGMYQFVGYIPREEVTLTHVTPSISLSTRKNPRIRIKGLGIIKKRHSAYRQAEAALKNENFVMAVYWLNLVLDIWPDSYGIRCKRAWVVQQLGDLYQAVTDLNIASHLKPWKPKAWSLLASVSLQMGIPEMALPHISRALELDQKNLQFLSMRSTIYVKLRQYDNASRDMDTILDLASQMTASTRIRSSFPAFISMIRFKNSRPSQPENKTIIVDTLMRRSKLYFDQSKYQLAKQDLDRLLQWDNKNLEGLVLRGRVHYRTYQYCAALSDFNGVIAIDPQNVYAYNLRALTNSGMGVFDQAIKDSDHAINLNPVEGYSYRFRSMILDDMGQDEDALDYANVAHIIDRTNMENMYRCLWARIYLYRYKDVLSYLNVYLNYLNENFENDDTDTAEMLVMRGFIYHLLEGREEDAFNDFRRVLEIDSKNTNALACRGQLYTRLGKFTEALADLNVAIEIDSENSYIYRNRAYLWYKMGTYTKSLQDLDTAENLHPERGMTSSTREGRRRSFLYRGLIYHKLGDHKKALDNLNGAITILQDDETMIPLVERAIVYFSTDQLEEALDDLKKALVVEPKDVYMSRSLSKGIELYGKIYNSFSTCDEKKLSWMDLREPDPRMPQSTLRKLKVVTSFQDDTNELDPCDSLKKLSQEFERLLSSRSKIDSFEHNEKKVSENDSFESLSSIFESDDEFPDEDDGAASANHKTISRNKGKGVDKQEEKESTSREEIVEPNPYDELRNLLQEFESFLYRQIKLNDLDDNEISNDSFEELKDAHSKPQDNTEEVDEDCEIIALNKGKGVDQLNDRNENITKEDPSISHEKPLLRQNETSYNFVTDDDNAKLKEADMHKYEDNICSVDIDNKISVLNENHQYEKIEEETVQSEESSSHGFSRALDFLEAAQNTEGYFDQQKFDQAIAQWEKVSSGDSYASDILRALQTIKANHSQILISREGNSNNI
ncbi:11534_t:CDS:1 [Acaulospora colombiana]|uniref:11534_t:CDS:1 n=1 Tax=Acaulospora colombiana TaxID=27376 RepID=A0ACA9JWK7_9GLOM|nr:11534_t:CDS:1 [Acaulospora colombiana]